MLTEKNIITTSNEVRQELQNLASTMLTVTGRFNVDTLYVVDNKKFTPAYGGNVTLFVERCETFKYYLRIMVYGQSFVRYFYCSKINSAIVRSNTIQLCLEALEKLQ